MNPSPLPLRRSRGLAPAFAVCLTLAACGAGASPDANSGAELLPGGVLAFEAARVESLGAAEEGRPRLEFDAGDGTLWVEQEVAPGDWTRDAPGGGWRAPLDLAALDARSGRLAGVQLTVGGAPFEMERRVKDARPEAGGRRDVGVARGSELTVYTRSGRAPGAARLLERRRVRSADGRVELEGVSGRGFAVPRDHALVLSVPAGPGGMLVLQLLAPRRQGAPEPWRLERPGEAEPRTLDDGWTRLSLEASADSRDVRLAYRGELAYGAVLEPRFLPEGSPPEDDRPDVLLFVADTFRADNLRAYAGRPGGVDASLTPFLDGVVEGEAAWFSEAWSPASWTLPAHGSLFTGLYPPEHTADRGRHRLPAELETLAERFSAAGYRTVAVTDGVYLTPEFGLDQGFDLFSSGATDMGRTRRLVAEALDDRDPRPRFLFVHTYRTHAPFMADPEARAATEPWLGVGTATFEELESGLAVHPERPDRRLPEPLAVVHRLGALYRAGARDFDGEFAELWGELEGRGFFERGLLAFTSDHGEAFGERGDYGHGTSLEESQTRIPLLLAGARVAPGPRAGAASLVDLGTTLAAWAGLGAGPLGHGRDLLAPPVDTPAVHGFQRDPSGVEGERATWTAAGKWVLDGAGETRRFKLPIDPATQDGTSVAVAPFGGALAAVGEPRAAFEPVGSLGAAAEKRLEALGYLAEDVDPGARER